MNEAAGYITDVMLVHDNKIRILEIEKKFILTPQFLKQERVFIREGTLYKIDRTGYPTPYIFHLFNDAFAYSEETSLGLKLHRLTEMDSNFQVIENPNPSDDYPHSFVIVSSQKSFVVAASSLEIRNSWFSDFKSALESWTKKQSIIISFCCFYL